MNVQALENGICEALEEGYILVDFVVVATLLGPDGSNRVCITPNESSTTTSIMGMLRAAQIESDEGFRNHLRAD